MTSTVDFPIIATVANSTTEKRIDPLLFGISTHKKGVLTTMAVTKKLTEYGLEPFDKDWGTGAVSYTHLDVYKRQPPALHRAIIIAAETPPVRFIKFWLRPSL